MFKLYKASNFKAKFKVPPAPINSCEPRWAVGMTAKGKSEKWQDRALQVAQSTWEEREKKTVMPLFQLTLHFRSTLVVECFHCFFFLFHATCSSPLALRPRAYSLSRSSPCWSKKETARIKISVIEVMRPVARQWWLRLLVPFQKKTKTNANFYRICDFQL